MNNTGVKLGAHRYRLEVNGLDEVGEEGALDAENVPSEDLVRAGHRQEAIASSNAVPRLDEDLRVDRYRPHSTLDLGSQHSPG